MTTTTTSLMESEEVIRLRASEERLAIVEKYDMGRGEEALLHIDVWEDPKDEIFHTTDRYGFIHDRRLPDTSQRTERERKQIVKESERSQKWAEMFKEEKHYFAENAKYREKMINRVYKGVPDSVRGRLWYILLDIDKIKKEQEGKYAEMRERARKHSPDIRQIDLDVNRTYRDHIMFRERYNERQQALFHVLAAYSIYNSEIGYCQGMSQIAALLLMYLIEEEDVFWAMHRLMVNQKYQMHGFYIQGFPKLLRFQSHHEKVLKKFLPKLKKHLDKQGIDTGIYTLKWFFQCFLDRIPFSLTLRVWDLFILEGDRVLVAMAYNILRMHRRFIMKLGMDEIIEYLQINMERNFRFEDDSVIERLREVMHELRSCRLDAPSHGRTPSGELPRKPFGMITFRNNNNNNAGTVASATANAGGGVVVVAADSGLRSQFLSEKEREFSQHTLQRQIETEIRLKKEPSLDEGSCDHSLDDTSLDESKSEVGIDSSFDTVDESRPPASSSNKVTSSSSIVLPPSPLPPSEAQDKLDDSLRLMLSLNNGLLDNNEDDLQKRHSSLSFPGIAEDKRTGSRLSHVDIVRIHVPYEVDTEPAAATVSPRYEGNKVLIPVNSSSSSSPDSRNSSYGKIEKLKSPSSNTSCNKTFNVPTRTTQ